MALTFALLQAEVSRIGGIDNTTESASAAAWLTGGLRAIGRAGAWPWLRTQMDITPLVAGTYEYSLPSDFFRLAVKTIRYAGRDTYLLWSAPEQIDAALGPEWKDSATANGTPTRVARVGNKLWIAPKPSAAFVAANAHLYGYYWRTEPTSGTLYLPDEFGDIAVQASLAYGWLQEDDPRAEALLRRLKTTYLPEMMGATVAIGAGDNVITPGWLQQDVDVERNYGDR